MKPIKWAALSNKEREQLVLTHIFDAFFIEDGSEETRKRYRGLRGAEAGYHYPVAYFDEGVAHWLTYDIATEPQIFSVLKSLDGAWMVVRAMNVPTNGKHDTYARFIEELEKVVGSDMFFDLFYCNPDNPEDQHLTGECICIAALRAVGLTIEA
jgi:hypothetical protein